MGKESSYIAASTIPTKLLHNKIIDQKGRIIPVHLQLVPTNICNLNCDFCSCKKVDRKKKLTLSQIMDIVDVCTKRGTKAVTITGGGEPLTYPELNEAIRYMYAKGLKVGLTTNGLLLEKLQRHDNLIWCRISSSDNRQPNYDTIEQALRVNPTADWAFAHVITREPNYEEIKRMIRFANDHKFSHIKLHPDLFHISEVPLFSVKESLKDIDMKSIIWQLRENMTGGARKCYLPLLKPMVDPAGIFPCCGFQYAIKGKERYAPNEMKMGEISDLAKILDSQIPFNGSICDTCYYSQYNDALAKLKEKPRHKEFV